MITGEEEEEMLECSSVIPAMGSLPAYGTMQVELRFHPLTKKKVAEIDDMSEEMVITQVVSKS